MNPILEDNLRALLARYRPVRPREAFVLRLRASFLERIARRRAPRLRLRPLALAALCVALVTAGLLLWQAQLASRSAGESDRQGLLARGEILLRRAPAAPWERASGEPVPVDEALQFLEVATPAGRALLLALGQERSLELAGATHLTLQRQESLEAFELAIHSGRAWLSSPAEARRALGPGRHRLAGSSVAAALDGSGALAGGRAPAGPAQDAGQGLDAPPGDAPLAGATLMGRVLRAATGRPVERYILWLRPELPLPQIAEPVPHPVTDAGGAFRLEGIDPGAYRVFVEAKGLAVWRRSGVLFEAGAQVPLEIALSPGRTVTGYVVDRATSAPIAGALVVAEFDVPQQVLELCCRDLERLPLANTRTDSSGRYELPHLSVGGHHLRVSAEGYAPSWTAPFTLEPAIPSDVDPVRSLPQVELAPGGRVEGRVEGPDGGARSGAVVILSRLALDRHQPVFTYGYGEVDAQGDYAIDDLPAGDYVALLIEGEQPLDEVRQVHLEGVGPQRVDFLAPVSGGNVFGELTGADGRPVSGRHIALAPVAQERPGFFQNWISTTTDSRGRYEFTNVPAGRYVLYQSPRVDAPILYATVTVPARGELHFDLRLPPGVVRGRARLADGGELPSGSSVVLVQKLDGGGTSFFATAPLGPSGEYRFEGVGSGTFALALLGDTFEVGCTVTPPLTVEGTREVVRDLTAVAGGRITLRVVDAEGRAVSGARVRLRDAVGHSLPYHPAPFTGGDGVAPLPPLAPGEWTVEVVAAGFRMASRPVRVDVGEIRALEWVLLRE